MTEKANFLCAEHANRSDCPDALVHFSPSSKSYGLIVHDGGSSSIEIHFCPWCGSKLSLEND
jgi:hypothetical protein